MCVMENLLNSPKRAEEERRIYRKSRKKGWLGYIHKGEEEKIAREREREGKGILARLLKVELFDIVDSKGFIALGTSSWTVFNELIETFLAKCMHAPQDDMGFVSFIAQVAVE